MLASQPKKETAEEKPVKKAKTSTTKSLVSRLTAPTAASARKHGETPTVVHKKEDGPKKTSPTSSVAKKTTTRVPKTTETTKAPVKTVEPKVKSTIVKSTPVEPKVKTTVKRVSPTATAKKVRFCYLLQRIYLTML
jgi:hypothetical protein